MVATMQWIAVCGLLVGLAGGCAPNVEDTAQSASQAEPAAPAEQLSSTLPPSVVVSDDPPRELTFSSQLNAAQRGLIGAGFQDEIANARLRGGSVTPTAVGYDLNADGTDEQFVQIRSDLWCGSGDVCNIWIYTDGGTGWTPLFDEADNLEDAGSCVSILPTATNGHRDLRLHGQCAVDMCTYDLRFDGTFYVWDGNRSCDPIPELHGG